MMQFKHLFPQPVVSAIIAAGLAFGTPVLCGAEQSAGRQNLNELTIEELMTIEVQTVYSASRYEQKVTEAPSSVTIISRDDIRNFGYRTLSDVLKSIRGFSVTYDRNYHSVGTRGFGRPGDDNTRILLLLDGHRLNDNMHDSASIGSDFIIDLDLIERIEISRGPGSSLYGSNAFFGVLNIITRNGRELDGGELSLEAGSHREAKGRATVGAALESGANTLFSGTAYRRRGDDLYFQEYDPGNPFFDPRAGNGGIAEGRDYERTRSIFSRSVLAGFILQAAYLERTKGVPAAPLGTDFNTDSKTADQRAFIDLSTVRKIGDKTDLSLRISWDAAEHKADFLYSGTVNKDRSIGEWAGGEAQVSSLVFDGHRLVIGAEYYGNGRQDQENYDQDPFIQYLNDKRSSRRWAGYIHDEFSAGKAFRFSAGVRYDNTSLVNGSANPRLAAIFAPTSESAVKLLYGSAFRSPSVYELYYQVPSSMPAIVANSGLKPEKIKTYELVYEQHMMHGIRTTVDAFYYRINDLINQTRNGAGNLVFENLDTAEARGLELEIEKNHPTGMTGRLSYSVQRATDGRTGEVLNNSSEDMAKLNLATPLTGNLVLGVEEQYSGRRKTMAGTHTGSFAVTNATLVGRNSTGALEVSLSCYNLFNKRYSDPAGADLSPVDAVSQDGRTVRIKVTYAF